MDIIDALYQLECVNEFVPVRAAEEIERLREEVSKLRKDLIVARGALEMSERMERDTFAEVEKLRAKFTGNQQ